MTISRLQPDVQKDFYMKTAAWITLGLLIIITLACTATIPVARMQTGETQTLNFNEPAPQTSVPALLSITMGAGTLQIDSGATGLVEGTIKYNVADWKPVVSHQGSTVSITQGTNYNNQLPPQNVVNDWLLKLGKTPTNLTINAGAYDSTLALGGIPLTDLTINDGASNTSISFTAPNPARMQHLVYKTGASTVNITGLGNANVSDMSFEGGAGSYILDFSGKLQQVSNVHISSGVSNFKVIVPSTTACKVILTGAMNSVNTQGAWTVNAETYSLPGQGPLLTITVELGVGSLELDAQ
jgi:hypothetical protein